MPDAYVLVRSDDLRPGESLVGYISQVDATLERFGATILVQNFPAEVPVGEWNGFITLLRFPSLEGAREWYDSPEYQAIRHLRTDSSAPTDVLVEGVPEGHRSVDLLTQFGLMPGDGSAG